MTPDSPLTLRRRRLRRLTRLARRARTRGRPRRRGRQVYVVHAYSLPPTGSAVPTTSELLDVAAGPRQAT